MQVKKKKPGPKKGEGGRPEKPINGRPKIKLDYELIEKLAGIFATQEEIATFIGVCVRTLQRDEKFCQVYKKGAETARMSLRRKQFKLADSNAGMAIFLGKNYLGQADKQQIELISVNDVTSALNSIHEGLGDQVEKILVARLGNGNGNGNNH